MIAILRNFLRSVLVLSPKDLSACVYLAANSIAPSYKGIELSVAETTLYKALSEATGRTLAQVKSHVDSTGDLGEVAALSRTRQSTLAFTRPASLSVNKVHAKLVEIANLSGNKCQQKKQDMIKQLLVSCGEYEAKYLVRALIGKLRLGLAENSLLVSLAHAAIYTPPGPSTTARVFDASKGIAEDKFKALLDSAVITVKNAYFQLPNFDIVVAALHKYGLDSLCDHCHVTPGVPIKPMLAHPTKVHYLEYICMCNDVYVSALSFV